MPVPTVFFMPEKSDMVGPRMSAIFGMDWVEAINSIKKGGHHDQNVFCY